MSQINKRAVRLRQRFYTKCSVAFKWCVFKDLRHRFQNSSLKHPEALIHHLAFRITMQINTLLFTFCQIRIFVSNIDSTYVLLLVMNKFTLFYSDVKTTEPKVSLFKHHVKSETSNYDQKACLFLSSLNSCNMMTRQ